MLFKMSASTNPLLAVRGTATVCRELNVAAWFLERVLREEAMTVARIGNARAWTDADVERLRQALGRHPRERRDGARRTRPPADGHQVRDRRADVHRAARLEGRKVLAVSTRLPRQAIALPCAAEGHLPGRRPWSRRAAREPIGGGSQ